MRLADFAGTWSIARRIDDRAAGGIGTLQGTARFDPDGPGLRYFEEGVLHLGDAPALTARQTYLWSERAGAIAVAFADGRPFHSFRPENGRAEADHDCPPDTYRVAYDFTAWPDWGTTWHVAGPRKNYAMRSLYRRPRR